jgi:hypothetical protein
MNCPACHRKLKATDALYMDGRVARCCHKCVQKDKREWGLYQEEPQPCVNGSRPLYASSSGFVWRALACSPACQLAFRRKRNREHMKAARWEAHKARWDARDKIRVRCAECGLEMSGSGF